MLQLHLSCWKLGENILNTPNFISQGINIRDVKLLACAEQGLNIGEIHFQVAHFFFDMVDVGSLGYFFS